MIVSHFIKKELKVGEFKEKNMLTATMENTPEVPQKTENRVDMWSRNITVGYTLRQNYKAKRDMHPNVHSSTVYNSQGMKVN